MCWWKWWLVMDLVDWGAFAPLILLMENVEGVL
jgi:hypothetical protein